MNRKISLILTFFLLASVSVFSQEETSDVAPETVETVEAQTESAAEETADETPEVVEETAEITNETATEIIEEKNAEPAKTEITEEESIAAPENEAEEVTEAESESEEAVAEENVEVAESETVEIAEGENSETTESESEEAVAEEKTETTESETAEAATEETEATKTETASTETSESETENTEMVNINEDEEIPEGIRNNKFYRESLRLTKLANETFEYGDYDASTGFAEEAIKQSALSDEYVSGALLSEAERLLAWADSNGIEKKFPNDYNDGKTYYETGAAYYSEKEWVPSILASKEAIGIFDAFEINDTDILPSQYTVRTWAKERDSLWTISGYPWVYSDPWKWKVLYEANKSKMPEPGNPDLIEPGMILDIPSIKDEVRKGMWRENN